MSGAAILRCARSTISAAIAGAVVFACARELRLPHAFAAIAPFACAALLADLLSLRKLHERSGAAAQSAESLKSAVLDALAHEIKGPFATIKVSVSTLLSCEPIHPAQQRELLEIADEEIDRVGRWIDDAIRMSRSHPAELRLQKGCHSMREVIARAVDAFGSQLEGRTVGVEIPASIPCAAFDGQLVEKVIRQLVDNALKYSPPGSPIRIWAEFTGAEIVVHVADWGCGVGKEDQSRIFEPHYRGAARGLGAPGTGLGLASAKCIMEAHGGEIWVNSVSGRGSIFHISLPATAPALAGLSEQYDNFER
jgi:two-component system sensor histidine kinase KdpD